MYISLLLAFGFIVAVTFISKRWKGVEFKRWAFLGIFFVFLVYVARYNDPRHDFLFHIIDLIMLGLGTFLIALNVEHTKRPPGGHE